MFDGGHYVTGAIRHYMTYRMLVMARLIAPSALPAAHYATRREKKHYEVVIVWLAITLSDIGR